MKLEVKANMNPTDIWGKLEPEDFVFKRQVYLDGRRLPPSLETVFLTGLDHLGEVYVKAALDEIKKTNWNWKPEND